MSLPTDLRIDASAVKPQIADISKLEETLRFVLPESYRTFLLRYNGGNPYKNTFDVLAGEDSRFLYSFVIRKFLGMNPKGIDDVLKTKENLKARLPEDYLPIAIDQFRNFMCLDLKTGQIFFYDFQSALKSERPDKPIQPLHYMYNIAPTFPDLLDNLYHKKFS